MEVGWIKCISSYGDDNSIGLKHLGAPHIAQQDGNKPYSAGPGGSLEQHMWTDAQAPPSYFEPKPLEATQVDSPAPETPVAVAALPAVSTPPTVPAIPSPAPAIAPAVPEPLPVIPSKTSVAAPAVPIATVAPVVEQSKAHATAAPENRAPAPFVAPSSGGATPTELEEEGHESASTAPSLPPTSGRDPSYWKLRRYFQPKAGGALKCSADAMKMWQTSEGRFWVRFVLLWLVGVC